MCTESSIVYNVLHTLLLIQQMFRRLLHNFSSVMLRCVLLCMRSVYKKGTITVKFPFSNEIKIKEQIKRYRSFTCMNFMKMAAFTYFSHTLNQYVCSIHSGDLKKKEYQNYQRNGKECIENVEIDEMCGNSSFETFAGLSMYAVANDYL